MKQIVNFLLFFILSINYSYSFDCITNDKDSIFNRPILDSGKIEISKITSGVNMTTGLVHVDIPANVVCSINIFSRSDNRLYSSTQQHTFILFPDIYNIEISGVILKEIPVNKGMDTRVRTGTLSVVSDSLWDLYDEDKKKIYSGSGKAKVGFPIGNYQIVIKGSSHKIEIRDRESIEYKDTLTTVNANTLISASSDSSSITNLQKKITPVTLDKKDSIVSESSNREPPVEVSEIMFGKNMATGLVHIDVAPDVECNLKIYNSSDATLLFESKQQRNFSLFPGMYDVEMSGMMVKNIQVNKAMDTRIKAGTLNITASLPWTLYNENRSKKIYSSSLSGRVEFPKGFYQLEINGLVYTIEIKDGEKLDYSSIINHPIIPQVNKNDSIIIAPPQKLNIVDSNNNNTIKNVVSNFVANEKKWEIKQTLSKTPTGRIDVNIPKEIESIITVSQSATNKEVAYSGVLTKDRNFSLAPGNYDVKVSGSMVKNVPVQKGMDTRIKAGILNVDNSDIWTLYDEKKTVQIYFSTGAKKIGLPIGIYQLEINGNIKPIIIKDGETFDFKN